MLDHNTFRRFWAANRRPLRAVFRAAVKVAAAQGLIGMIGHAVDGTKIRAGGAQARGYEALVAPGSETGGGGQIAKGPLK